MRHENTWDEMRHKNTWDEMRHEMRWDMRWDETAEYVRLDEPWEYIRMDETWEYMRLDETEQVSWLRQDTLHILSAGHYTYVSDARWPWKLDSFADFWMRHHLWKSLSSLTHSLTQNLSLVFGLTFQFNLTSKLLLSKSQLIFSLVSDMRRLIWRGRMCGNWRSRTWRRRTRVFLNAR